jgi:hypothetical protein
MAMKMICQSVVQNVVMADDGIRRNTTNEKSGNCEGKTAMHASMARGRNGVLH